MSEKSLILTANDGKLGGACNEAIRGVLISVGALYCKLTDLCTWRSFSVAGTRLTHFLLIISLICLVLFVMQVWNCNAELFDIVHQPQHHQCQNGKSHIYACAEVEFVQFFQTPRGKKMVTEV